MPVALVLTRRLERQTVMTLSDVLVILRARPNRLVATLALRVENSKYRGRESLIVLPRQARASHRTSLRF